MACGPRLGWICPHRKCNAFHRCKQFCSPRAAWSGPADEALYSLVGWPTDKMGGDVDGFAS